MAVRNVNKGFVYITDFTASLKIKHFDRKIFCRFIAHRPKTN